MQSFYERCNFIIVDGMSLVLLARLLRQGVTKRHRVTYADWIWPLSELAAAEGWRVFFLGGRPGVGEQASAVLQERFEGLDMRVHHGYFDPSPSSDMNRAVLAQISSFRTQLLMVGMGMPRQEIWLANHLSGLEANLILSVGACMDFVAGVVPTAPRWMGRTGLEWLFRLGTEPRRLTFRYLVEPWFLIPLLVKDLWSKINTRGS
jgi:N-acetylglucosaminyldiphosphoundecaprenol N-acetyl-beta-D-mannosaminyltransferase